MHKYDKSCIQRKSSSNSQLANIAIDVIPPLYYQKKKRANSNNAKRITPKLKSIKESSLNVCNHEHVVEEVIVMDNSFVVPRRTVPRLVLKELSKDINFDETVLKERCPGLLPFSQYDAHEIYKNKLFIKNNKLSRQKTHINPLSNVKPLFNVRSSKKSNSEKSLAIKPSTETFLLGCVDSFQVLKPTPLQKNSEQFGNISKYASDQNNSQDKSTIPATNVWEDRVLSRLSSAAADILLRDANHSHIERYVASQHTHKGGHEKVTDNLEEEKTIAQVEPKVVNKVDSAVCYFENIQIKHEKHENNVQLAFPCMPSKWWLGCEHHESGKAKVGRVTRGMQKWVKYPTAKEGKQLVLQQASDTELCRKPECILPSYAKKYGYPLLPVLNEWRDKWVMDKQYVENNFTGLMLGMEDVSEHIRFAAVSCIAPYVTEKEIDSEEEEMLLNKAEQLLYDASSNVSLGAAILLFCMNNATTKATEILMDTVKNGRSSERWVSVQCLVEYLYHDNCVIRELISNIVSDDMEKRETSIYMLKKVSHLSMAIQFMVAEKLNSGSWRDRVVACHVLPNLDGALSKDIANKLSYLLWNDWSADVRKAAAEALGKTGNGKLVHNMLSERLQSANRIEQITGLKKIASLGIMTAHLLSPLIRCLESDDDEVSLQTMKICIKMKLNDESILNALVKLLNSDRACKVRRYTLRTLGRIGHKSDLIRDNLLWTVHFNKEPILRREACSTMVKLGFQDEEIINVLQDIVFIDKDESVKEEVANALCSMGVEAVGNKNLIQTIQQNVKQLCNKEKVIALVVDGVTDKFFKSSAVENSSSSNSDNSDNASDSSSDSDEYKFD